MLLRRTAHQLDVRSLGVWGHGAALLAPDQAAVDAPSQGQLRVAALLLDAPLLHDHDVVRLAHRAQPAPAGPSLKALTVTGWGCSRSAWMRTRAQEAGRQR